MIPNEKSLLAVDLETTHILIFLLLLAFLGLAIFFLLVKLVKLITKKEMILQSVFTDFGKKMWMTVGLGIYFAFTYFFLVLSTIFLKNFIGQKNLFDWIYHHPLLSAYIGLSIFVLFTVSIYLIRRVIKHLYLSRLK